MKKLAIRKLSEETREVVIDVEALLKRGKEYVNDLGRIIQEWLPKAEIKAKEKIISVTLPKNVAKRELKLRISKYIHKAGLKNIYRINTIPTGELDGYKIKEIQ